MVRERPEATVTSSSSRENGPFGYWWFCLLGRYGAVATFGPNGVGHPFSGSKTPDGGSGRRFLMRFGLRSRVVAAVVAVAVLCSGFVVLSGRTGWVDGMLGLAREGSSSVRAAPIRATYSTL